MINNDINLISIDFYHTLYLKINMINKFERQFFIFLFACCILSFTFLKIIHEFCRIKELSRVILMVTVKITEISSFFSDAAQARCYGPRSSDLSPVSRHSTTRQQHANPR